MRKFLFILFCFIPAICMAATNVYLDKAPVDLEDKDSLQRGARNFINYCLNCHSANYMRYSQLLEIGLSEEVIKKNLLFTQDKVGETMAIAMNKQDAAAWFGAPPPNLSVTARSRGADWIYSYLRSFYKDSSRDMGWNNLVFSNAAMPHILWELQGEQLLDEKTGHLKLVKAGIMTPKEYDQFVADLTNYMVYMSEPHQQKRKQIGYFVIAFLVLLLILTINLKREYWKNIK